MTRRVKPFPMSWDAFRARARRVVGPKKKPLRRAPRPRRWLLWLALVPVLSLVLYAAAARWLLSGPALRAQINGNPESLTLDYDSASSLWPGRLTIRNLRIRGSDRNVQWIIRLNEARVEYSMLALASRTFRVQRLQGAGLAFALRNKVEPEEVKNAKVSLLPPIPGFADPPLRSPEAQGPAAQGNPWRVEVHRIGIANFGDIWMDAFHYRGEARLDGAFFLRPGRMVWIGPARVLVAGGEMRIGGSTAGVSVAGSIDGRFEPFDPRTVHGNEVWQRVSGAVKIGARFDRLEALEHFVTSSGAGFEDGVGQATIAGSIERGIASGGVELVLHDGSVRLRKLALRGDADLRLRIPTWNLMSGPLEISGSQAAFSNVRTSGSDESRRWWGRFDIPTGRIGANAMARIVAETRDARPLLALLSADLPTWTRGLVNLDAFSATGTVSLGPSLVRVRRLDATGGNFHIQGRYFHEGATRNGAFLIESGALAVGLEMQPDATKLRLVGARRWYEEQETPEAATRSTRAGAGGT